MIAVLAGGVGAARFLRGLVRVVPPEDVTVISNTGDDIDVYGTYVSPDLDIVTYTLGGIVDAERGWGIEGDTFTVLEGMRSLGADCWFMLGDRDFATCLARRVHIDAGGTPSTFADSLSRACRVTARILPMTDQRVETRLIVLDESGREEDIHFQEYWVARRAAGRVKDVRLAGAASARPAPGVIEAIEEADAVIVAPSNPVVSIGTILAVPGIREALRARTGPVTAVSPIVGGAVVRGMADKLMPVAGMAVSCTGVATAYADFIDTMVIDLVDASEAPAIEALGVRVEVAQTMMRSVEDAAALAKRCLP